MILVIGDIHFREKLAYSEYIEDKRQKEWNDTLDFIIEQSENCEHVVFMGDQFNSKNNTSEVNRAFVAFLERFGPDKHIYLIAGNHEKFPNGKSAMDFLSEIKGKKWWVINKMEEGFIGKMPIAFIPYMYMSELGVDSVPAMTEKIMGALSKSRIIFSHHAISSTTVYKKGVETILTSEPVLPVDKLKELAPLIIGGHIHEPQQYDGVIVTGSIMTSDAGEHEKFIWKVNQEDLSIEKIKLPVRGIYGLIDPTEHSFDDIPKHSIVKVTVTKKEISLEALKAILEKFDGYVVIAKYPDERKRQSSNELSEDIVRSGDMNTLITFFCNSQKNPETIDIPHVLKTFNDLVSK